MGAGDAAKHTPKSRNEAVETRVRFPPQFRVTLYILSMSDNDGQRGAPERIIDARGLACPLPVSAAQSAEGGCARSVWTLLATDPVAARDVPLLCCRGHEIVVQERRRYLRFRFARARVSRSPRRRVLVLQRHHRAFTGRSVKPPTTRG